MKKKTVVLSHPFQRAPMSALASEFDLRIPEPFSPSSLRELSRDAEGLISFLSDPLDSSFLEGCPNLRIVANYAVGFNNIDVGYALGRGIYVTNTPDVLTEATADLAFSLLLAVARRIPEAERFLREGRFEGWGANLFLGQELFGKTVGIVGMGRIGKAFARRCLAFGLKVLYTGPRPLPRADEALLNAAFLPLEELLPLSDFLSLHLPLTPESRHLLDRRRIGLMKPGSILINTSRGPIVDEEALADSLLEGRLWGAGLDVFEQEPQIHPKLLLAERTVLLPHIGSATEETRTRMAWMTVEALKETFAGRVPPFLVPPWRERVSP